MSSIDQSAYSGNWRFNLKPAVKYTPDALVFLNGDTSLPGCVNCRGRIEIQRFITSISVDAGTDATSHTANVSLSLPRTQGQQLFRDGHFIIRPGLEVNIYMRGYFPLRGAFDRFQAEDLGSPETDPTKWVTYPYYPVFHGVITNVSGPEYSDGNYTGSFSCSSLLHFWQYVNISTSAAHLAQKPTNDPSRPTLFGHTFNNMHPFGIMYTLYRDTAGAAAGVEFALSGQSNVDASAGGLAAAASDGGRQLYDAVALYWEQRFKTRVQNLRMYGVNGRIFNSVQQAYLGSASNRDLQNLLPSTQYGDPKGQRSETDPFSTNFSIAKSLGLSGGGIDVTYANFATEGTELVGLNMLDMFAFNQSMGEVGTINLFETTYQTKLDIVNAVTEITGYEFYQDVDGDLVFKPPFYNLDTSTNPIYRLEDQEIISFAPSEKEPQATYINVRGTWFKGWTDIVPNDGATAKRSVYVDYKLVSRFGWRQASLDISYTTDPRMLFYIGMARLDLLNIDVFSATCTIPIRPELRPGYPVYIPFIDTYYYITQISHSFSFGGSCTTSLTLTCRRSKFFAPGFSEKPKPGESAIWKIRLDRPDLPSRPLEVYENNILRYVGFPNVVMALDPTKANPSFFPVGAGIDYLGSIEDVRILFNSLREDIANLTPAVLQVAPTFADPDGKIRATVPTEEIRYRLQTGPNPEDFLEFGLDDLYASFSDLQSLRNRVQNLERDLSQKRAEVATAIERDNKFATVESKTTGTISTNQTIDSLRQEENLLARSLESSQGDLDTFTSSEGSNRNLLLQLFSALQRFKGSPQRRKLAGADGADVTAAYFESLMHLKSQYLAEGLPGRYRYYSSAHPDPTMQGQPILIWDDGERPAPTPASIGEPVTSGTKATTKPTPSRKSALKKLAEALNGAIETAYNIQGWTIFALAFIQEESNFNSNASNPALGKDVAALIGGTGTKNIKPDRAKKVSAQFKKKFGDNPYIGDPEHWGELGAAGWYQLVATSSMSAYAKGQYTSMDPQQSQLDPTFATAAFAAAAKRTLQSPLWKKLPAQDRTWLNFRRAVGGLNLLQAAIKKKYASKKWSSDEARSILVDDSTRPAKLRFTENFSVDQIKGQGLNQAGRFLRGLINGAGLSLDQGVSFMNSLVPEQSLLQLPGTKVDSLVQKLFGVDPTQEVPPPAPPSTPKTISTPPEASTSPSIKTQDITIPPRTVIQFKPTVSRPSPKLRFPEAELGLGSCTSGINIAQGPGHPPRPISTDQIQTLSFARFSASKFSDVLGNSVGSGRLTLDAQALFTSTVASFMEAGQAVQDPSQTPSDVFKSLYEEKKTRLESIEIPVWRQGLQTGTRTLKIPSFSAAIDSPAVPDFLAPVFPGITAIPISTTSFSLLSSVPGYGSTGRSAADGQSLSATYEKVASGYAQAITSVISSGFTLSLQEASTPAENKQSRLGELTQVFNQLIEISTGSPGTLQVEADATLEKTSYPGKIERPIHVPVFPVSDEKGYEHYGAYRYGRGLSVDPGGTFSFVHEGGDPFSGVSAQTAELFLQALTTVKSERAAFAPLRGIAQTAEQAATAAARAIQESLTGEALVGAEVPEEFKRRQTSEAESFAEIRRVAEELSRNPRGQQALNELLSVNGDNPNLIQAAGWDVSNTQFENNFSNFAANYALSGAFKTTIANVAYQLSDITGHIHSADGTSCVCRGSLADVLLEAYSRTDFIAVEGINPEDPGNAYSSELFVTAESTQATRLDSVSKAPGTKT